MKVLKQNVNNQDDSDDGQNRDNKNEENNQTAQTSQNKFCNHFIIQVSQIRFLDFERYSRTSWHTLLKEPKRGNIM